MTERMEPQADQQPRLAGFRGAGQTLKPDALADTIFTVVDTQCVLRRDGTQGYKWIVKHDDGTLGIYWAAGFAPPHQVAQWFRENPAKPLRVALVKTEVDGYSRWELHQQLERDPDAPPLSAADEELLDQVPF